MDKVLCLECLETDPSSGKASKEWLHWKCTFDNFLDVLHKRDLDKLSVMANDMSPSISQNIKECTKYEATGGYYKHFCETLKWNLCRPYPCHEVPTTSQNVAWIPFPQWIPRFLDQIKPIASCRLFPLPLKAVEAFESLKKTIEDTVVTAIDETNPTEVKMDESKVALAATQPEWKTCCLLLTNPSRHWASCNETLFYGYNG